MPLWPRLTASFPALSRHDLAPMVTVDELAAILRISPKTIHNHRTNGTGPTILHQATKPFGNRGGLRWRAVDVAAYLDAPGG